MIKPDGAQGDIAPGISAGIDVSGVLDAIEIPIVVVGRDCTVAGFNRAATEALGVTGSDIGRRTCNMQALADLQNVEQLCIGVMADEVPCRHDVRNGDRWFLLHISPYHGTDRKVTGAILTFTNVTAFRASVAQAIYEREYTKSILNAVIDPMVVLDERLQIQTANRAFYEWFGVAREQTQGLPLSALGDHAWKKSALWSALKATVSDGREFQSIEFERDFLSVGRRAVLLDARRLVRDRNVLLVLTFRDITARKQAERALHDSEGRFASGEEPATEQRA